ncbi:MAG: hypothetical protein CL534_13470 [Ahrensia sp.]|nr:hypothetical protein [Ahrensia sp.]
MILYKQAFYKFAGLSGVSATRKPFFFDAIFQYRTVENSPGKKEEKTIWRPLLQNDAGYFPPTTGLARMIA